MTDPAFADLQYVRSVLDLLDAQAFGIPLKSFLDLVLLTLVVYGTLTRGARAARWVKCKMFSASSLDTFKGPIPTDPQADGPTAMSQAGAAAYDLLCLQLCTYDAAKRRLSLPGLMVEFIGDDATSRTVKHLVAAPVEEHGKLTGVDLEKLLDASEKDVIVEKAQQKRADCVARDRAKANREAARALNKAAHAARLKMYDAEDCGGEYELSVGDDSPAAEKMNPVVSKWLGAKQLRGGVGHVPIPKTQDRPVA